MGANLFKQPDEMAPPWEAFPTYPRHSMGWRMGVGEGYAQEWHAFIDTLPSDYDVRLGYLKRHRPAPVNMGKLVLSVLEPDRHSDGQMDCSEEELQRLLGLGLVEYDAAYYTWLNQQPDIAWPWLRPWGDTPEDAARYGTREFWFFSRQLDAARQAGSINVSKVPRKWRGLKSELLTGRLGKVEPARGLLSLAQLFCAGTIQPPWAFGLSPIDFRNSFDKDMGYCDAFRLWIMDSFDDDILLRRILQTGGGIPDEWAEWVDEHARL